MNIAGTYDREVGILYSIGTSTQLGKDVWYTDEAFTFHIGALDDNRFVTVPKAFLTDGASVPRAFWSIFPPWGVYGQAAVVHDYLCIERRLTCDGNEKPKYLPFEEIDKLFYQAMKASGTSVWKRSVIYAAVRLYHLFSR